MSLGLSFRTFAQDNKGTITVRKKAKPVSPSHMEGSCWEVSTEDGARRFQVIFLRKRRLSVITYSSSERKVYQPDPTPYKGARWSKNQDQLTFNIDDDQYEARFKAINKMEGEIKLENGETGASWTGTLVQY